MVLISAVIPAPEEGSKPAMVRTTGGFRGIIEMYRKPSALEIRFATLEFMIGRFRAKTTESPHKQLKPLADAKKHAKCMKTITVQILHTSSNLGYLLLYKHLTCCYYSNICIFAQVVQQVT